MFVLMASNAPLRQNYSGAPPIGPIKLNDRRVELLLHVDPLRIIGCHLLDHSLPMGYAWNLPA